MKKPSNLCAVPHARAYRHGTLGSGHATDMKHKGDYHTKDEVLRMVGELGFPKKRLDRRQCILHHHERDSFPDSGTEYTAESYPHLRVEWKESFLSNLHYEASLN